jgi:hypothetical protein
MFYRSSCKVLNIELGSFVPNTSIYNIPCKYYILLAQPLVLACNVPRSHAMTEVKAFRIAYIVVCASEHTIFGISIPSIQAWDYS